MESPAFSWAAYEFEQREHASRAARRAVSLAEPAVMGVLNVTPDSFSDGGRYVALEAALERVTRDDRAGRGDHRYWRRIDPPGRGAGIDVEAELERVLPVVEALRARSEIFISVDTSNPAVIQAVCAAGADMINDIRGSRTAGRAGGGRGG